MVAPDSVQFIGWMQGATPHHICLWVYYHGVIAAVKKNQEFGHFFKISRVCQMLFDDSGAHIVFDDFGNGFFAFLN